MGHHHRHRERIIEKKRKREREREKSHQQTKRDYYKEGEEKKVKRKRNIYAEMKASLPVIPIERLNYSRQNKSRWNDFIIQKNKKLFIFLRKRRKKIIDAVRRHCRVLAERTDKMITL